MLEVRNLTIEVKDKKMIQNLNFILNKQDKMAIIGEEGNGKSTLLKCIINEEVKYAKKTGDIIIRGTIGYLPQELYFDPISVWEYLEENMDYNLLYQLLKQLKLNEALLESNAIQNLSGGEKVKVALLKLLLKEPDILILDEPTNDLDIESLEWLEQFIKNIKKPVLYVSHDETLLERSSNKILHIEQLHKKQLSKWTVQQINYKNYIENRLHSIEKQTQIALKEKAIEKKKREKLEQITMKVDHQLNTITRKDPHGAQLLKKKMKSLKSQEKKLNKKEPIITPDYEDSIHCFFEPVFLPLTKEIINYHDEPFKTMKNLTYNKINLEIIGPQKVAIIGKNGVGKTTLIHKIYENLKKRKDIKLGYMPQQYDEVLNPEITVLDFLKHTGDQEELTKIRTYLGNLQFKREEMICKIKELSGGTKAKLLLLNCILKNCNVLILDEPTRNLSPLSNPVIRNMLKEFNGCIISVSHDRKYIKEVCDIVYLLDESGLHMQKK